MNKKEIKQLIILKYDNVVNYAKELNMPAHQLYHILNHLDDGVVKLSSIKRVVEPLGLKLNITITKEGE